MSRQLSIGQEVWVKGDNEIVWEKGTVESKLKKGEVVVNTKSGGRLLTNIAYECNNSSSNGYPDMTSMTYINEPSILCNLEDRSYVNCPYTFMGPVLVAVNPLKRVEDSSMIAGSPSVASKPHPFSVAEMSYQQLKFGCAQMQRGGNGDGSPVSQTVVVGGESGAGKTESSKMVLKHLVQRCGGGSLDKKLLGTNPILESFGNASTLRNENSSRFGKLLKLHFDDDAKSILGASIGTYLLERSRVTTHEKGERGYHIFYQVIVGLGKEMGLAAKTEYRFLSPESERKRGEGEKLTKPNIRNYDGKQFEQVHKAFVDVGIDGKELEGIFQIVAAILHLGNITFVDEDRPEGFVASVDMKNDASKSGLQHAAKLLGFADTKGFARLFCERKIQSGGGGKPITVFNESTQAKESRNAVARSLYSRLFNFILVRINFSICDKPEFVEQPTIGVLDIFGFESFKHNGFEQLLINYTNESLQATFNEQIFHAEAELYKREKLVLDSSDSVPMPKGNGICMSLLEGNPKEKVVGVLELIDQTGQLPKATDVKLNEKLHKTFGRKNECFGKVHPKDMDRNFVIHHYAGHVTYTVGTFLAKNGDTMPKEVDEFFQTSTHPLLSDIWASVDGESDGAASSSKKKNKKKKGTSIVAKFRVQIMNLKDDLNATRCSFIRCIKPNPFMKRESSNDWVNRRYVTQQLKALSVLQTAEVLKNGFPTRITYESLTESYSTILPDDALSAWRGLGGASETAFVGSLFWAFGIPRSSYKLGITRVFFRSGMLAELDGILSAANDWNNGGSAPSSTGFTKDEVFQRFRQFFARRRWRVAYAKAFAVSAFMAVQKKTKGRSECANKILKWYLMSRERKKYLALRKSTIFVQKSYRMHLCRKEYVQLLLERNKEIKKREEETRIALQKAEEEKRKLALKQQEAEKLRKKLEMEEANIRKQQAQAKKKQKEIEQKEKNLSGNLTKFRKKLEEKRKQRMQDMEDMQGGFVSEWDSVLNHNNEDAYFPDLDDDDDMDEGQKQFEVLQREKQMNKLKQEEQEEKRKALREQLQRTEEELNNLDQEVEENNRIYEATKEEHQRNYKQWRLVLKKLEAKKLKQMQDNYENTGEHLDIYNYDQALQRSRHRNFNEKIVEIARKQKQKKTRLQRLTRQAARKSVMRRSKRRSKQRAEEEGIAYISSEEELDSDNDDDDNYSVHDSDNYELEAVGEKLPTKESMFSMFKSWKKRKFILNKNDLSIRYFKVNERRGNGNVFKLNRVNTNYPTKIYRNPKKLARQRKNVLWFKGGHLASDHATSSAQKRRRQFIMSFKNEGDMNEWMIALSDYMETPYVPQNPIISHPRALSNATSQVESKSRHEEDAVEVEEEELKEWSARDKMLDKQYDEDEKNALLLNAIFEDDDEMGVADSFYERCDTCSKADVYGRLETHCKHCGAELDD